MKRLVFLLALGAFILAGCEKVPHYTDDDFRVSITFSTQSLSSSLLKSTENTSENSIEKVMLFGMDKLGNVVQSFPARTDLSLSGFSLNVSRKVKFLYAIANPSEDIEMENPKTVSDLMNMICDLSKAPVSPFIMGGIEEISSTIIDIKLFRTVAKVEFTGINGFQISSVTVQNTPDRGFVFKKDTLSTPRPNTRVTYSAVHSVAPTVYISENSSSNHTQFVVKGSFNNKQAEYTIVLKCKGININIARNANYQVNITPVTESECDISIAIPLWEDVIADHQTIPKPPIIDPYANGIKILAIGNSFAQDAMAYMNDLFRELKGVSYPITLVTAYIGGGSLQNHADNVRNKTYTDLHRITFNAGGQNEAWSPASSSTNNTHTLESIIREHKWDVITLQQSSDNSGIQSTYDADLDFLIDQVVKKIMNNESGQYIETNPNTNANTNANPNFRLGWHMTWAWHTPPGSWGTYGSQTGMYSAICTTVQAQILNHPKRKNDFDFIIPVGTAIQNARHSNYFGNNLGRDDKHLNNHGKYIAGVMWIKTITGWDISGLKPYSSGGITSTHLPWVVPSVNEAAQSPYYVTPP